MSFAWLLLLIAWPLIEIAVLIKAGNFLGFWLTLAIVVVTGLLGTSVLMRQGLAATFKVQDAMLRGETPLAPMMEGALVATAGVLLITPGLCADMVGLLLLIPPLRQLLARIVLRRTLGMTEVPGGTRPDTAAQGQDGPRPRPQGDRNGPVIEGEFERLDERTVDPKRPPGGSP